MAKIKCNLLSYTLKRAIDIEVILPTPTMMDALMKTEAMTHKYPHKMPVLYLLHGYGNNQAQWGGYTNIELYAEERQIVVVTFAGENKMYVNTEIDQFEKFIQEELPEFIINTFPVSTCKEDTYIAGLSMGGFGALYHGLVKSNAYQAIGAFSPAILMEGNRIDLVDVVKECHSIPSIYISCGDKDFVYEINVEFIKTLESLNIEYTWVMDPGFDHEWRFWDKQVEAFLDWIPRTDAYAGVKSKYRKGEFYATFKNSIDIRA